MRWFLASRRPARSRAARIVLSSGGCENLTVTSVPPRKSTPQGIWCQNSIENTPATLKISEKARKYHFFPRKSMLVLRKNSTGLLPLLIDDLGENLNVLRFPAADL